MPPLKNIKHEKFAQAVIEKPSYTQAYAKAYGIQNLDSARSAAPRLLANNSVKNRIQEILQGHGITLGKVLQRYNDFLHAQDLPVQSWDATKTGLKMFGVLDSESSDNSPQPIQIIVATLAPETT